MTYSRAFFSRPQQTDRRKELRSNLTPAEATLWELLKSKKLLGRKFRKQHGIGRYIVDFCCPSECLIIELDGEVHNNSAQAEYDAIRDAHLRELGFIILRFENKEVFQNTEAVLQLISSTFKCSVAPSPNLSQATNYPLPAKGGVSI